MKKSQWKCLGISGLITFFGCTTANQSSTNATYIYPTWVVEAPHAIAPRAAEFPLPKTIAVLLEAAALPTIAQLDLALIQAPHELFIDWCKELVSCRSCPLLATSTVAMSASPHSAPLRFAVLSTCLRGCGAVGVHAHANFRASTVAAASLLQGYRLAALAEPHRGEGPRRRAHAGEVARVVAPIAQQELVLPISPAAHFAHHELDCGASRVAAHLSGTGAAIVEHSFRVLARPAQAVGALHVANPRPSKCLQRNRLHHPSCLLLLSATQASTDRESKSQRRRAATEVWS